MRLLLAGAGSLLVVACGTLLDGPAPATPPSVATAPVAGATPGTTPCPNPEGFTVPVPAGWSGNSAGVLPACSWFGPGEVVVPEASDARTTPITFQVQPVPLPEATATTDEVRRTEALEVDGHHAVRTELVTRAGLYPVGTPITTYAVDLDGRTLVADAVGLAAFDHGRDVAVLDAMMAGLDLHP
ncbi:hypothetical protein [Geodermatophilus ruber]|uniref:Uncharacterized protein n=1 Tax=Geodermatophilus ruber TaxID=504800 RepID=A0A1I4AQ84_9ACTN|nr:hypothetical protein [Geodermatophilus ruber]SFK58097.1 hypothetical protein SAMN04488085_102324 [Geodermatophilus ruber]